MDLEIADEQGQPYASVPLAEPPPPQRPLPPSFAFAPPPKGERDPVAEVLDRMDFSPAHSVINTEWVQAQVDELRWLLGRSHPDD